MTAATMRQRWIYSSRHWRSGQKRGPNQETRIARWCVARCLRSLGRLEEALAQQRELLAEEEAFGETAGFTWEEIGECLLALGREVEARPHFAQAYSALSQDAWLIAEEGERLARLRRLGGFFRSFVV